jgi:hypothetical protein
LYGNEFGKKELKAVESTFTIRTGLSTFSGPE